MDITARVVQLWCLPKHEHKVMDPDFAESIIALVTEAHAAGKEEGRREMARKASNKFRDMYGPPPEDEAGPFGSWLESQAKGGA